MELKKIIDHHQLDTFYQPIVELDSERTIGYEALNRPAASYLFPNTEIFYDFVGQTDQVFLFECFCRNISLKRFMDRLKGNFNKKDFVLFINIHPHVLMDANYHSGETLQLLQEFDIEPGQVVFELTEKSAVTDFEQFEKVLSHYRSQGFRIAVDDVGSGYNSLKTLIYLKPEFIKLDRSLIDFIDKRPEQQRLVSLIVDYAKQSHIKIIAEGIERMEELEYIKKLGVDYAQGYALGMPQRDIQRGILPTNLLAMQEPLHDVS
ncbi:EAL domain-containing protein [Neobacillus mesonae]|uniref:EAL domain-containing protein n=1 Tax=Neobacillus mesonae TaxID=1193713 RepID=UPI00203B53E9|nr:EAL domain-containing protein [Neobacillus mesonae]MCM3567316.1 EAL domain-containing protein [Neobacillus mesonae]